MGVKQTQCQTVTSALHFMVQVAACIAFQTGWHTEWRAAFGVYHTATLLFGSYSSVEVTKVVEGGR
jgi:hypothetical protein